MDIGRSFTFMFDDKDWLKKIAIGGVLNIIPIVNFLPIGYGVRTARRITEGTELPLPEWDDWGGDFMKGLMVFLAGLIYALPVIVLQILSAIVAAVADQNGSDMAALCVTATSCLSALWGLAVAVVLPAGLIRYAVTDDFGAFFRFGELFSFIGDNLSNYIIAILLSAAASIVAGIVGGIACGVGVFWTQFWATLVTAYLLAHVWNESRGALTPVAPAPPPTGYTGPEAL